MWLPGLHIPETYIAALVQAACRDKGWPLDKSTLYTKVTKFTEAHQVRGCCFGCICCLGLNVWLFVLTFLCMCGCVNAAPSFQQLYKYYSSFDKFSPSLQVAEKPRYGCFVSGLYLEGASWDLEKSQLRKQDPKVG